LGECESEWDETLTCDYHRQHHVDVRIVRIFNTYGPRMLENDGRVVSNFISQALRGNALTVYGDGSQTRSFCYVSDLVDGFVRLMANESCVDPVNLGNPEEYTILQLASEIKDMIDPSLAIAFKPLPSDDPRRRCPDIGKAKSLLQWSPSVGLERGLKSTIDYFKSTLSL
jgi:UDP-glucuronate decarboxylase